MNDKLEDLLYESGLTAQGCWDELDDYAKEGIEKFAELLVRECADIAAINSHSGISVCRIVKEHFGAE